MKKQAQIFFTFLFLAATCISCSSNRVTTADDQLSSSNDESASNAEFESTEGSTASTEEGNTEEALKAAQSKAEELLNGGDKVAEVKLDANPLEMGTESTGGLATLDSGPNEGALLAQADPKPAPVEITPAETSPPSLSAATMETSGENAPIANTFAEPVISNEAPHKPAKKAPKPFVPRKEAAPVKKETKMEPPAALENPVAKVMQPDVEEALEPIPAADAGQEPQLASAEIATFIERHVFLVTIGVVGFVFALFIVMRRNKSREDNLTL